MGFIIILSCFLLAIFSIRKNNFFLNVYSGQLGLKSGSLTSLARIIPLDHCPFQHILQIKIITFSAV